MKRFILPFLLLSVLPLVLVAQRADLSGLKFCIDPGHGGNNPANDRYVVPDPGTEFWESESNYQKALLLKAMIEERGGWVILTRYTNHYPNDDEPSSSARAEVANSNNVNIFHSIHSNAFDGKTNYTLMLYRGYDNQPVFPEAKTLGAILGQKVNQILRTTSYTNRGDWTFYGNTSGLGVLRPLVMPGVLSEGSFHDFYPETRRLMNNDYRKMEAYALRNSFMQYYGVPADTLGIIAGLQTDAPAGRPKNATRVRLLPENRLYTGDSYNNGFYMFDGLTPGVRTVRFETPGYSYDSVQVTVTSGGLHFVDRTLQFSQYPIIYATVPSWPDTSVVVAGGVSIQFSRAMDTLKVQNAISISSQIARTFKWSADFKTVTVFGSPSFRYHTWYTVHVDSAARSADGYVMDLDGDPNTGDTYQFSFRTEPAILIVGAPISFGQVKIADSTTMQVVLRNRSDANQAIRSISTKTTRFVVGASLPLTINALDSVLIPIRFTPSAFGTFVDTLTVNSDSGLVRTVLSGSSPAYALTYSHSVLGFASTPIGTPKERPIYFTTNSINGVRIDTIYTKTRAFSFSESGFPKSLSLGDTLRGIVVFNPDSAKSYNDTLFVLNNGAIPTFRIGLLGSGSPATSVDLASDQRPLQFTLHQNFPNPFNPETWIAYDIPADGIVKLTVFDLLGRHIRTLVDDQQSAGRYRARWDGRDDGGRIVPSGIYIYRIQSGFNMFSKKMSLVR
ncbi:MAG: T9SS type A sorting domain-containing protein [Ignavibacteria bacterium]|nr:T9SS type A sorting domain-containing protein [Ignavibacteria bacterium]